MCGIAGFVLNKSNNIDCKLVLKDMLSMIHHRGPDQQGIYYDNLSGLATARLKIVDHVNGNQPLLDNLLRYVISFNGEVYNYQSLRKELISLGYNFRTKSDTEVVLYAWIKWGHSALEKFNGPFALAIYDRLTNKLFLARDKFGKRPLYYTSTQDGFFFSSELKAFLAIPKFKFSFDEHSLSSIIGMWCPYDNLTAFDKVYSLSPGCFAKITSAIPKIDRYHFLNLHSQYVDSSLEEAASETHKSLTDSTKLRIPEEEDYCLLLSGGLDSTILASILASEKKRTLRTYAISFDDQFYDEKNKQEEVSRYFKTDHQTIQISNEDIIDNFSDVVWFTETPLFRSAPIPMYLLAQQIKKDGIKVAFSGEGADELFLGYNIFKETKLRSLLFESRSDPFVKNEIVKLYPYLNIFNSSSIDKTLAFYSQTIQNPNDDLFSHQIRLKNNEFSKNILMNKFEGNETFKNYFYQVCPNFSQLKPLQKAQAIEIITLLSGYLLTSQSDKVFGANGIENRVPFLDQSIFNVAVGIDEKLKLNKQFIEKHVLRHAFRNDIPESVYNQIKTPYRAPSSLIFKHNQDKFLEEALSRDKLESMKIFNTNFCQNLVKKVFFSQSNLLSQREDQSFMFLLSLSILYDQYILRKNPHKPFQGKIYEINGAALKTIGSL